MYRCKNIFTHDALIQYDSILIVVTLPRHISYKQVTAQCQFTIFCSIALSQDIACLYTLTFTTDWAQVNSHVLVCTTELRNTVFLQCRLKTYEFFLFRTVVQNTDSCSVYIFYNAFAFSSNHCTRILTHLLLNTSTYDRSFIMQQWHSLTHHVRSHQSTVSIIMLQERNQRCSNRCYLLWRHIHSVYLIWWNNREISLLTPFNTV